MAGWRQAIELALSDEDIAALAAISRSRTDSASRVERARMLLAYRKDPSFFAVGQTMGVHHQTVKRCVERALAHGPMAALDETAFGKAATKRIGRVTACGGRSGIEKSDHRLLRAGGERPCCCRATN